MKFFIETIGCQMNVCDSDAVSSSLLIHGAVKANTLADADIAVLNTCSVRAQAEQKAFSWLGRAEELKAVKKDLKIIVIGCMAQRLGDKIKKRFKSVDLIVGAKEIDKATQKILALLCGKWRVESGIEDNGNYELRITNYESTAKSKSCQGDGGVDNLLVVNTPVPLTTGLPHRNFLLPRNNGQEPVIASGNEVSAKQSSAVHSSFLIPHSSLSSEVDSSLLTPNSSLPVHYVTIMRGCDNYCSYCVVPFVRGNETSINCEDILKQCETHVKNGAKEIMLLGQNVNSYNHNGLNFTGLMKKITAIDGLETLTFMTSHPKDLSDELIDIIASELKIKKYIHLPMQSASDKILDLMNRKYTYSHYKNLIDKLRTKIPNINITTDIIVGFPQETEEDFNQTLQAVKDIKFNAIFIFKYSPRPNTKAAQMKDDVPLPEKKKRHNLILEEAKRNK